MKEFKSIAQLIENGLPIGTDSPVGEHLQQALIDYWREHVGIAAAHSYPLLFQSARLVVFCDSAAWATQLRHQTPSLLRQLNDNGFQIAEIKIKIRPLSSFRPPTNQYRKKIAPLSKANAKIIRELAAKVEHSGLKQSLLRLAKGQLRKPIHRTNED